MSKNVEGTKKVQGYQVGHDIFESYPFTYPRNISIIYFGYLLPCKTPIKIIILFRWQDLPQLLTVWFGIDQDENDTL